jgi:hypothetical protein
MDKLLPCEVTNTVKWRDFLKLLKANGATKSDAQEAWEREKIREKRVENYRNEMYHAMIDKHDEHGFGDDIIVWTLSIKRHDREPICDWRDFQEIKNQLCGEQAEGMMLYPAESRVVDTANQYWMYVFMNEGFTIPVGFTVGVKMDTADYGNARQRSRT